MHRRSRLSALCVHRLRRLAVVLLRAFRVLPHEAKWVPNPRALELPGSSARNLLHRSFLSALPDGVRPAEPEALPQCGGRTRCAPDLRSDGAALRSCPVSDRLGVVILQLRGRHFHAREPPHGAPHQGQQVHSWPVGGGQLAQLDGVVRLRLDARRPAHRGPQLCFCAVQQHLHLPEVQVSFLRVAGGRESHAENHGEARGCRHQREDAGAGRSHRRDAARGGVIVEGRHRRHFLRS
mmetsp:Transcript_53776/g.86927  ORF Transcript_53776/g.86927 Transcript_53776/m.86927 type:complete len:237 (-) Transcript_53776:65-775(-)